MNDHRDPDHLVEQITANAETYGIRLTAQQRDNLRALVAPAPGRTPGPGTQRHRTRGQFAAPRR